MTFWMFTGGNMKLLKRPQKPLCGNILQDTSRTSSSASSHHNDYDDYDFDDENDDDDDDDE